MSDTLQHTLDEAGRHLQAFDFEKAFALYGEVLKRSPNNGAALLGVALIYNRTGNNTQALQLLARIYQAIEAADPGSVQPGTRSEVLAQMGLAFHVLEQHEKAIQCYVAADKVLPNDGLKARVKELQGGIGQRNPIASHMQKAEQALRGGKPQDAVKHLKAALKIHPDHDGAQHALGNLYRQMGQFQLAMPLIQQAIIMQPRKAEYQNTLGMLFQQRGELEKAATFYKRAINFDDRYAAAHCNLGVAMKALNRLDDAVVAYQSALRIDPNLAEAHNNLGNLLRIRGDLAAARRCLDEALRLRPGYPDALKNLEALAMAEAATPAELVTEPGARDKRVLPKRKTAVKGATQKAGAAKKTTPATKGKAAAPKKAASRNAPTRPSTPKAAPAVKTKAKARASVKPVPKAKPSGKAGTGNTAPSRTRPAAGKLARRR